MNQRQLACPSIFYNFYTKAMQSKVKDIPSNIKFTIENNLDGQTFLMFEKL